jgi:hypothetical protein
MPARNSRKLSLRVETIHFGGLDEVYAAAVRMPPDSEPANRQYFLVSARGCGLRAQWRCWSPPANHRWSAETMIAIAADLLREFG